MGRTEAEKYVEVSKKISERFGDLEGNPELKHEQEAQLVQNVLVADKSKQTGGKRKRRTSKKPSKKASKKISKKGGCCCKQTGGKKHVAKRASKKVSKKVSKRHTKK